MKVDTAVASLPGVPPGLDEEEALRRLQRFGPNELPQAHRRGIGRILLGVLREPMFLLLMLAATIYLAIGGIGEGLLMIAFAALSVLLVVAQEARSENALEALRSLAAPTARVVRNGRERHIPARDLVPGDVLLIADGERIAADCLLRSAEGLGVDESLLTGESVPVPKRAVAHDEAVDERASSRAFASTLAVSGRGVAEVVATGSRTEAGRIGASLGSIEVEPTLLQRSLGRIVRWFGVLALAASTLVVLLYGWLRGAWLDGVLSGIAFGMSALPEEFPMVLTVFVALGARRLARLHVLVRRTAVIEVLGACTTLCLDKTGTLTENRMRVCALSTAGKRLELAEGSALPDGAFGRLVHIAALASAHGSIDPMDLAVHRLARASAAADPPAAESLVREFGLAQDRPMVVRICRIGGVLQAAAKGAPEAISALCRLGPAEHQALRGEIAHHASMGRRVLAVALARLDGDEAPREPEALAYEFCGLLAFADPPRACARAAIDTARRAGVKVAMITGDHPLTALAIAREVGIDVGVPPVTGAQIDAVDEAALCRLARSARVFARIRPEQKLRIVRALKANGEIVAMTGDGVNDAPALKASHIGLAMGKRGTDVAREAASIVLMDDDLSHLVAGIETGRRIFDNLRKATIYITAVHVPIAGLALMPLLLGLPPLLLPMHVVLIEMVIDPICAIAFENEPVEPGTMEQPPRPADDPPLGWPQMLVAFAEGALLLAAVLGLYGALLAARQPVDLARTLAFLAFGAGNLMLVRVVGTRGPTLTGLAAPDHRAYWTVAAIACLITTACVFVPVLQRLFRFEVPSAGLAAMAIAVGLASALLFDLLKFLPAVQRVLGRRCADRSFHDTRGDHP